jgi:hypothetical protein
MSFKEGLDGLSFPSKSMDYFSHSHSEIGFLKRIDLNQWVIFPLKRTDQQSLVV